MAHGQAYYLDVKSNLTYLVLDSIGAVTHSAQTYLTENIISMVFLLYNWLMSHSSRVQTLLYNPKVN